MSLCTTELYAPVVKQQLLESDDDSPDGPHIYDEED